MQHPSLFTPIKLGRHLLKNRIVCRRSRASAAIDPGTCRPN